MKTPKTLLIALVAGTIMAVAALGCYTMRGAGKDIQKGGQGIENAAENAQQK